jgi:hypothetical protein
MPTPTDYKIKSYSHFAAHCSVTAKAQDKFTRHQNLERYRRLLKTAKLVVCLSKNSRSKRMRGTHSTHIKDDPVMPRVSASPAP